ncbi:MAG TPA: LuxR C-terminal-related transcriptional regulator, partial [Baekduia sp.]
PAAAAGYLRRALDEAPPDAMRRELLAELGHAEVRAGEPTAVESLSAALAEAPDRERHAGVALELGRALLVGGRLDDAVALLAGVLDGTPALDPDTALRLEAELITASRLDARSRPLAARRLASIRPDLAGARPGERLMLAHLAYEAVTLGEPAAHAATLARRALAGGTLLAEVGSEAPTYYIAASALSLCDHLREADAALTAAQRAAQEAGSAIGFAIATSFRASVRVRQGALVDAEADARSVLDSAEHGWHPLGPAFLVDALVERGALDEAETILESIGMLGAIPENMLFQPLLYARGDLRIAQGRLGEGVEDLLEGGRRAAEAGIRTPAFRDYRSSAAHGLARLGRVDEARGLAREELELARRFGAPRALAIALRCAGQLEGGATGLALLRDAADAVAGSEAVLERARCLLELGAATRRAGRRGDACPPLREALEIAHACGADPLAEQARTELAAAGSRPRRPARSGVDALTASERRVAHLATEGMTNREIAQALFVTLKTVEWHLAHAYRKLGIAGRAQLASALGGAAGSSSRASPAEAPVPTPAP